MKSQLTACWRFAAILTSASAQVTRTDKSEPITIQEQGSFAVGGNVITNPGTFNPKQPTPEGQTLHGDHAYAFYQIPVARSMGIDGTDQAALAKLRALSAEEVLRGAPAQPGSGAPSYETTPVLDGKLITETAETAYKAKHEPLFRSCSEATAPIPRVTESGRPPRNSCSSVSGSGPPRRKQPTIPTDRRIWPRW